MMTLITLMKMMIMMMMDDHGLDHDDHNHGEDDCIRKKTSSLAANRGRYMAKASQTSSQSHHITPASQQVYFYSKAQRKKSSLDPYVQPVPVKLATVFFPEP